MRFGLNSVAIVAIALGTVVGAVAAAAVRPMGAVAIGAAATCLADLAYRIVKGSFENAGAFLSVRPPLGSPTRVPVWIIAFGIAAGGGVISLLHYTDESESSQATTNYLPSQRSEPPDTSPVASAIEHKDLEPDRTQPLDSVRSEKFLKFYRDWLNAVSDTRKQCAAVLTQMRSIAHRDGGSVHEVYASGQSLPPALQQEFERIIGQLQTSLARCPDIDLQDEIAHIGTNGSG